MHQQFGLPVKPQRERSRDLPLKFRLAQLMIGPRWWGQVQIDPAWPTRLAHQTSRRAILFSKKSIDILSQ
jgi:hypothetical protein